MKSDVSSSTGHAGLLKKIVGTESSAYLSQHQPYAELRDVFEKQRDDILAATSLEKVYHVGSTSIEGMPGALCVDVCCVAHEWPVPSKLVASLESIGFESLGGIAQSGEAGGFWFLRKDVAFFEIHPIDVVLHLVKDFEALVPFIAFREYCRQCPEAFESYRDLKLDLMKVSDGGILEYKKKKSAFVKAFMKDALSWYESKQLKIEDFKW